MHGHDVGMTSTESGFSKVWCEDVGEHKIWGATSLMADCEPHFHGTYSMAHVTAGTATILARECPYQIGKGNVLLINPYEIVSVYGGCDLEYEVYYPSLGFMRMLVRSLGIGWEAPRFARFLLEGDVAAEIGAIISVSCQERSCIGQSTFAQRLADAITRNRDILEPTHPKRFSIDCVGRAFAMIENLTDEPISVNELCKRIDASRSYFVRCFSSETGLPPSRYIRQLRLARGLERVLAGAALAEAAIGSGFADQAHFTREFRRVYGTTPGKLTRTSLS